ncbi:hypothetical protein AYK20_06055 [Thermoplasmatales archaeon SG8-52-1]|nr:MAG: hypothetical protein AYK20_06055 [Thermoplasmatales archaeon SG8-52-1]
MRKILIIVLIGILLIGSQSIIGAEKITRQTEKNIRDLEWTIMIYLNGDNALSVAQGVILEEIRQVGSTAELQLAVLIDQNQDDDTKLYYIIGTTLVQQSWPSESSMDDADTIKDFVLKVQSDYPANHYELIISSNKGSGWQGICWDDHGDGIMITMPELLDALNQITNNGADKLDILGIETCMTGNTEVAYQIRNCVDIFIAYPECGVIGDWPYSEAFNDLIATPAMTPSEYAIATVEYFVPKNYPQYDMITTMAATELSYLDELADQINDLAVEFMTNLDEYREQITSALESARIYALLWDIDYYIDFYNFLELLTINDPNVVDLKDNIMSIMDSAVIANKHLIDDPSHGLSIYFPRRSSDYNDSLRYDELPSPYEETLFAIDTQWDEFLKNYLGIIDNQAPEKPIVNGPEQGIPGTEYEYSVQTIDPEGQDLHYYIDWDDGTITGWIGSYASGEEVTFNHTYEKKGKYTIRVKARDEIYAESDWGKFDVTMPRSKTFETSRILLFGKISYLEKNQEGDFRFLPVKLLEYSKIENQGRTLKILDETYGEYPCCGYIQREYYKGIVTKNFIAVLWTF